MSKRLILILALAFVVGLSAYAYAEVQNVKVSGDINVLGVSRQLELNNNEALAGAGETYPDNFLATITRVRVDADLTDNVMTTVRLLNERYWGNETENAGTSGVNSDIQLDLAYVTLKEFLYSPLSLTVGRQELHFGNDMIVGDPDTNNAVSNASPFSNLIADNRANADLSARKAFDAVRATLNYDPLVVDVIGAKITENTKNSYDDTDLYGVNVGYDLNKKTKLEGYWFEQKLARKQAATALTTNKPRRTDVIGARIVTKPIENLTYELEAAYQFGRYSVGTANQPTVALKAWALETFLTYDFKKVKYTPSLTGLYAYFSGDSDNYNTNAGHRRGWNVMYENQKFGEIHNALWNQTNQHIVGLKSSMKPMEDITLKGDFYAYWLAKRFTDNNALIGLSTTVARTGQLLSLTHKSMLGKELDITAIYDYTEDVQFSLLTGVYWAGNALGSRTDNTATEIIGSMKVTF